MIASAYIKNGNICIYNERRLSSFSYNIGGITYELGRPLLDFVCYEKERIEEGFNKIVEKYEALDYHEQMFNSDFMGSITEIMTDLQKKDIYTYFYTQGLLQAICLNSPARETANELLNDFNETQAFIIRQIELLFGLRKESIKNSPLEYLHNLERINKKDYGRHIYFKNPLSSLYNEVENSEIVELYEINSIQDLFRFEFIKMIENNVFIKKCKNCERFFIPRKRADVEYCERIFGDCGRKCSEIGATLRYEQKVAGNPILTAYKKAYRRLHSRVRSKKVTQSEFLKWSEEAGRKRDECLAGVLGFEEFSEWLDVGRVRRSRGG